MAASGSGIWTAPTGVSLSSVTDPTAQVSAATPGAFDLLWTVAIGGCVDTDTVRITFHPTSDAAFAYGAAQYCVNGPSPAPWTAEAGGTFSAVPAGLAIDALSGSIDLSASVPGDYLVSHLIGGACPASAVAELTIIAAPNAAWTPGSVICSNHSPINLDGWITGTPGGTWSGQNVSGGVFDPSGLSGSIPLTYTIETAGCTAQSTQPVIVQSAPAANAGPDQSICGDAADLSGTGQGQWTAPSGVTFYGSPQQPSVIATATAYGTYAIIWTEAQGSCSASDTVLVTFLDPGTAIWVEAGEDQRLEVTTESLVTGSASPGASLIWTILSGSGSFAQPTDSSTSITGLAIGDNVVVLTASLGICASVSDTLLIHVADLFIPQGYSPNGDGTNDRWVITGLEAYPASELRIFNRWGHPVYATDRYGNDWEGRSHNGQALPDDTYFYVLNLGGNRTYNGHVIIKR